jgi:trigger factor
MSPEQNELKVSVLQPQSWSRRLSITVPNERVRRTRQRVASQISGRARLPGFRPGKVPAGILEKRFGPAIEQETLDQLIQEAFRDALQTENLQPITQGKVDNVEYDGDSDLTFEVEFEVRPEIEIARVSGFSVSRPQSEVGDNEVENVIERLREERAEWSRIDGDAAPDLGQRVTVEITVLESAVETGQETPETGEPRRYRFVLGAGQAIPNVEEAILTLKPGESGEFNVSFPDDFPDETRRGQKQKLRIELFEIEQQDFPEIDDDFARAVGEFENVEMLRERILQDLQEDARRRGDAEVRRQLIDLILQANPFELPQSMVERYLDHMTGHSHADGEGERHHHTPEEEARIAQMREALRPEAEWSLKRLMVVDRIADQQQIRASQDEIDARIAALAEQHGRSESEVWLQLEKSGQLEQLEREITEQKVFEHLEAENTVT